MTSCIETDVYSTICMFVGVVVTGTGVVVIAIGLLCLVAALVIEGFIRVVGLATRARDWLSKETHAQDDVFRCTDKPVSLSDGQDECHGTIAGPGVTMYGTVNV